MKQSEERPYIHYELLRIFAAFSVVVLHAAAQSWYHLPIESGEWFIANAYDALFRFGVPVFVMISGALFLGRDKAIDIKRLYSRNILRMVVIYVVWSFVYSWYSKDFDPGVLNVKDVVRMILDSSYHLWFLPMLVGLYILLPVLHSWVRSAGKANIEYLLAGFVILQIGRETIKALTISDEVHTLLDIGHVDMMCGYVGYFVLGHYIANIGIPRKWHKWIYIGCMPALAGSIMASYFMSLRLKTPTATAYDSFSFFTFLVSVAVFLAFTAHKEGLTRGIKCHGLVRELSADTFGAYLVHLLVMYILNENGIHSRMYYNFFGIPVLSVMVFVISMATAALLRRIPVIGRYIC